MRLKMYVTGLLVILSFSCAKRVPVSYDHIDLKNHVEIKTKQGPSHCGVVDTKNPAYLVLNTDIYKNTLQKIEKNTIDQIFCTPPVYDEKKNIISEWEIKRSQKNRNTVLYTIGGTSLSFGLSFFTGSMIYRGMSESENGKTALVATTGIGTALGSYLFYRGGKHKDRDVAISKIREERYVAAQKEMEVQKGKREKVKSELEKSKAEREKQDAELKRLQEEIEKKKKQQQTEGDID